MRLPSTHCLSVPHEVISLVQKRRPFGSGSRLRKSRYCWRTKNCESSMPGPVRVVIHISPPPKSSPTRSLEKKRVLLSAERYGARSSVEVLMTGPRLAGVDHKSEVVSRIENHRSIPPEPPGRFDDKMISNPP